MADQMPLDELEMKLGRMREVIGNAVQAMPTHQQFIDRFCKADPLP
jgi:tryptophan halogenase